MKYDDVAIIILNYKSWKESMEEVDLCNTLLNVEYKNIIVIDNASPNDSSVMLDKFSKDKGFVFIKSLKNKGYASGNNLGLQYAYSKGYKYAWILNNDIIIEDADIIEKLVKVFKKDHYIAVVNPDIYAPDGHLYNRDAKRPTLFDYTLGMIKYKNEGRNVTNLGGYAYVYRPQGCCMMVELSKINEVGFMDENTFLYMEESILAERLLERDYHCACCLTTSIIHNHSKTINSAFAKRKIRRMNNESFRYYLQAYRKFNVINIGICCIFNYIKLLILG